MRKLILIVGGILSFIILVVIFSAIFSGGSSTKDSFISLAQTQQEIARVADAGVSGAVQQTTKNVATTAELTMMTHQQQVLALLKQQGIKKLGDKQLALKQDATTDQKLNAGRETSTYDTVFLQILQDDLQTYSASVKQLSGTSSDATQAELFGSYYEQAQLILSQIKTTPGVSH